VERAFTCSLYEDDSDELSLIDEVLATGVWQTNIEGQVWWAMARTCAVPESGDASLCSENGTQNCAVTTHLTLTHRP
jgi:hypothetical protein